jgi:hypothetical protein
MIAVNFAMRLMDAIRFRSERTKKSASYHHPEMLMI